MHGIWIHWENKYKSGIRDILEILNINDIDNPTFAREFSSIARSDLILVTSDFEYWFLVKKFGFKNIHILWFLNEIEEKTFSEVNEKLFLKKKHFFFIGNFQHWPNLESAKNLIYEIWPKIRK